ncbi:MAG: peptidoglycan DD-metalloendopeptidase family protein [Alistipes sp.]|nr:peptidoglycan DD-metalloendopeptidase family protein [Alistipes sp.]
MKNVYRPLAFLTLVFLAGCGTSRQASRSIPDAVPESGYPQVTLYPKGYEGGVEREHGSVTEMDHFAGMDFSGLETEHVRVRGVNPLPATGRLEVNLSQLQGQFVYPYKGRFLSDYGMRDGRPHTGIDIKTIPDDTIRAVLPGVVRVSRNYSSYGNIVVIRHAQGFETVYAHCSRNLVSVNDRVKAGTPIGLAGRTGRATTEHLHFEVRVAGDPVDPKLMLDIQNERLRDGMFYAEEHEGKIIAYNDPAELRQIKQELARTQDAKQPAPPKTVAVPDVKRAENTADGTAQYHTVVKGDTLYAISRKYSTTVARLCSLNNIKETDILSLGQRIRVK